MIKYQLKCPINRRIPIKMTEGAKVDACKFFSGNKGKRFVRENFSFICFRCPNPEKIANGEKMNMCENIFPLKMEVGQAVGVITETEKKVRKELFNYLLKKGYYNGGHIDESIVFGVD